MTFKVVAGYLKNLFNVLIGGYFTRKKTSKKQVDRRASKGRKIRYKEIPKLVNFTFPLSRSNNSNLDQDEWFQSLFGGIGSKIKK